VLAAGHDRTSLTTVTSRVERRDGEGWLMRIVFVTTLLFIAAGLAYVIVIGLLQR
jgi:hypothetical protein